MHICETRFTPASQEAALRSAVVHMQDLSGGGRRLRPEGRHSGRSGRRRPCRAQGPEHQGFRQGENQVLSTGNATQFIMVPLTELCADQVSGNVDAPNFLSCFAAGR